MSLAGIMDLIWASSLFFCLLRNSFYPTRNFVGSRRNRFTRCLYHFLHFTSLMETNPVHHVMWVRHFFLLLLLDLIRLDDSPPLHYNGTIWLKADIDADTDADLVIWAELRTTWGSRADPRFCERHRWGMSFGHTVPLWDRRRAHLGIDWCNNRETLSKWSQSAICSYTCLPVPEVSVSVSSTCLCFSITRRKTGH